MASAPSKRKKVDANHVHLFKLVTTESKLNNESWRWGESFPANVVNEMVDVLKQRKCKCGKVETYDLQRVPVGSIK